MASLQFVMRHSLVTLVFTRSKSSFLPVCQFCTATTHLDTLASENTLIKQKNFTKTHLLHKYKQLNGKKRNPSSLHILDREFAAKVVEKIGHKLQEDNCMLFELNPGPGVMTDVLLESGIKKLRVFEWQQDFISHLKWLETKHEQRLEIFEENFFELPKIITRDFYTQKTVVQALFQDVKTFAWTDKEVPLKIFAIVPPKDERMFLSYITRALTMFKYPFHVGRTEFFFFVTGKEFAYQVATPFENFSRYRKNAVLMQLFFETELLHVEPRSSFYPLSPEVKVSKFDTQNLYLLRITPRRFFLDLVPPELLPELHFFIHQNLTKPKQLIIPSLEQWIPGCGLHFLKAGIRMHTRFGELTPNQILLMFLHLSSLPEYSTSVFQTAAKQACFQVASDSFEEEVEEMDV